LPPADPLAAFQGKMKEPAEGMTAKTWKKARVKVAIAS